MGGTSMPHGLRQYRDMVKVSTPSSCLLRVRARPGALSESLRHRRTSPCKVRWAAPCFVVAPSDGGDYARQNVPLCGRWAIFQRPLRQSCQRP